MGDYGGVDEMTFQMYGYGGFGYDTSGIRPDEHDSNFIQAAKRGDVDELCKILNNKSTKKKIRIINQARRWTEVDYKMSGFTKEYEWYDLTPLSNAAVRGHTKTVEYLLRNFADPTLIGCPCENVHVNAKECAERHLWSIEGKILKIQSSKSNALTNKIMNGMTPKEYVDDLFKKLKDAETSMELIKVANSYWEESKYSHSRFQKRDYESNKPTNNDKLLLALDEVMKASNEVPDESMAYAAFKGYTNVVEYLLRNYTIPTQQVEQVAEKYLHSIEDEIKEIQSLPKLSNIRREIDFFQKLAGKSVQEYTDDLFKKLKNAQTCITLIHTASNFWNEARKYESSTKLTNNDKLLDVINQIVNVKKDISNENTDKSKKEVCKILTSIVEKANKIVRTGVVVSFKLGKGYLKPDDGCCEQIIVHQNDIAVGYVGRNNYGLKVCERVQFTMSNKHCRFEAKNVTGPNGSKVQGEPLFQLSNRK